MTFQPPILVLFLILNLVAISACKDGSNISLTKDQAPELISLAEKGHTTRVAALLSTGRNPNIHDSCKWTPLMKASLYGHQEIVKLLLLSGAEVDQADKGNYTSLLLAASRNHAAIIELLLAHGADINHQEDTMGWSALIWATKLKHTQAVTTLLKHDADMTLIDHHGNTALMWAKQADSADIIGLIKAK